MPKIWSIDGGEEGMQSMLQTLNFSKNMKCIRIKMPKIQDGVKNTKCMYEYDIIAMA